MENKDYLSPFAIVNRAICEGADERQQYYQLHTEYQQKMFFFISG